MARQHMLYYFKIESKVDLEKINLSETLYFIKNFWEISAYTYIEIELFKYFKMNPKEEIINCKNCILRETCGNPIPWDGNFNSKIMIIWEAPWKEEDIQGKPFVWRSGKLLTKILEELWYYRETDYYITNIVKCRPPDNRDPKPDEIKACSPSLWKQIEEMKPELIITLWRFSFNFLVPNVTISEWRWNFFKINEINWQKLDFSPTVLAVYHPAVALYNPTKKELIKEDLSKIKQILPK